MSKCIFCDIVEAKIPSNRVFEDNDFLAFLDIAPVGKGHTLLIPKEHYETIMDLPDDLLKGLSVRLKQIAKSVMQAAKADGISISQSNREAAGQVVPHIHFHIIPRFAGDGLKQWPQRKYEPDEMESYRKKIAQG